MQFDTERRHVADPIAHDRRRLRRRDDTLGLSLNNDKTLYFLDATLGTPGQKMQLYVDTGSSDLWVNVASSRLCQSRGNPCSETGTYDKDESSTYNFVNSDFNISYADGSSAAGDYATDTLKLQGQTIKDMQFGIGFQSSTPQNILGIGYETNEAQVASSNPKTYQNLPAKLVADGVITSSAYSLWLNDLDANKGSLLFGGVDKDKYEGDLVTMPVQKIADGFYEFFVTLTGVKWGSDTLGSDMALGVLLDSGSTLTYLPDSMVADIYNKVDAAYDQSGGTAYVDCSMSSDDLHLSFSNLDIKVPFDELVIDLGDENQQFQDGTPACLFGIAPSIGGTHVLGDTFLRSAYVVYDLDNNEISMAQTKYNVSTSDVVEISKGKDAVPNAKDASNDVAAESGLPDQQGPGVNGNPTGDFPFPTGATEGDDDDDDAAGMLSPPTRLAACMAIAASLVFGRLLM